MKKGKGKKNERRKSTKMGLNLEGHPRNWFPFGDFPLASPFSRASTEFCDDYFDLFIFSI